MKNFLKRYGKDMNTILVERLRKCPATGEASRLLEEAANEIERLSRTLDGLPDGAIDGGWTAAGMSAYAARLEQALKPFADHPEFHAPDDFPVTILRRLEPTGEPVAGVTAGDFRRAKVAMGHNAGVTGSAAFGASELTDGLAGKRTE